MNYVYVYVARLPNIKAADIINHKNVCRLNDKRIITETWRPDGNDIEIYHVRS